MSTIDITEPFSTIQKNNTYNKPDIFFPKTGHLTTCIAITTRHSSEIAFVLQMSLHSIKDLSIQHTTTLLHQCYIYVQNKQ